jgi:rare lipoprotein A
VGSNPTPSTTLRTLCFGWQATLPAIERGAAFPYLRGSCWSLIRLIASVPRRALPVLAAALLAAGCASSPERDDNTVTVPPNAGVYKIGQPYEVQGVWYYPKEQPDYDETGLASWYGSESGIRTANGERFDPNGLTAAHRTLPMPVNVRVTNLDNGKSLVVRVNDRGPFARGRIIDVSARAAQLLGFYAQGTARVRVTYLSRADINGKPPSETPPEIASAVPAAPTGKVDTSGIGIVPGTTVAPPVSVADLPAPTTLPDEADTNLANQPTGQVTHVPVPAATQLYIQAGAFSSYDNALRLKTKLAASGDWNISSIDRDGHKLYRLRLGPFRDTPSADAALARVTGTGSNDAKIVVDR